VGGEEVFGNAENRRRLADTEREPRQPGLPRRRLVENAVRAIAGHPRRGGARLAVGQDRRYLGLVGQASNRYEPSESEPHPGDDAPNAADDSLISAEPQRRRAEPAAMLGDRPKQSATRVATRTRSSASRLGGSRPCRPGTAVKVPQALACQRHLTLSWRSLPTRRWPRRAGRPSRRLRPRGRRRPPGILRQLARQQACDFTSPSPESPTTQDQSLSSSACAQPQGEASSALCGTRLG
jgi:hypothetical protein